MVTSLTMICDKVISGITLISNKICYLYVIRGLDAVKKNKQGLERVQNVVRLLLEVTNKVIFISVFQSFFILAE